MTIKLKTLDLSNPADAREYIRTLDWGTKIPSPITFVTTSEGREIQLAKMTDQDAVFVAQEFYDMHLEAEHRQAKEKGRIQ